MAKLQADVARGFRWYRVHILDNPLSEYTLFELHSYLYPELIDDVQPYRDIRDTALRHAEPLDEYLARKAIAFPS